MTTEERAKNLVKQYRNAIHAESPTKYDISDEEYLTSLAKVCATICVNNTIENQKTVFELFANEDVIYNDEYWQDVKRDIRKVK